VDKININLKFFYFYYSLTGCLGPWELTALQVLLKQLFCNALKLLRSIVFLVNSNIYRVKLVLLINCGSS